MDPMVECGYTWIIDNFSGCSDRVGVIIKSPIFSGMADRFQVDWSLQLYPNGVEENCKGHNQIRTMIANEMRRNGMEVHEEVSGLSACGSILRIDIMALDGKTMKGVIVDPTIRFELDTNQPEEVNQEKREIYLPTTLVWYVSLYLYLVSCNKSEIDANFKLSILNRFNMKCKTKKKIKSKFIGTNDNWGFPSFVKRSELLNKTNGLLVDDKLRIHCFINIGGTLEFNSLPSTEPVEVIVPESSLAGDFWQLYTMQNLVDVTVIVNGKEFKVHKSVLAARSSVFATMFDTDMAENNMNRVEISDIEPEVFVELLRFMYSDKADNLEKVACGLLACAEKYNLERLKVICEESISANLTVDNAADVLLLADLHRATWLKRRALDFIKGHALEITRTEGWKTLINYPQLVAEAFKSLAAFIDDTIMFG